MFALFWQCKVSYFFSTATNNYGNISLMPHLLIFITITAICRSLSCLFTLL